MNPMSYAMLLPQLECWALVRVTLVVVEVFRKLEVREHGL
jgi:hypothetical protein